MQSIGVKELRNHLSQILSKVEKGEVIRVLRHGKHIVELRPIRSSAEQNLLDSLNEREILESGAATGNLAPIKTVKNLRPELPISDLVTEDRG
jgi:prevent-host-death family protein